MALSTTGKNDMLDELRTHVTHVSIHTADPGNTGTSEVTGGTYARVAVTWGTPANGTLSLSSVPVFQIPAGSTITHFGLWTSASGGQFFGGFALDSSQTYGTAGTYTVDALTITQA